VLDYAQPGRSAGKSGRVGGFFTGGTLRVFVNNLFLNLKKRIEYFLVNLMTRTLPCGLRANLSSLFTEFSTGNVENA
jgi:hypothetical protein